MFAITTDGMENTSRRYDSDQVKEMIERQKENTDGNSCSSAKRSPPTDAAPLSAQTEKKTSTMTLKKERTKKEKAGGKNKAGAFQRGYFKSLSLLTFL